MQGKHWKITNALSPRLLPLHVSQRKKDMLPLILPGLTRGNERRYIPGLEYMQKSCSYCVPVDLQGWHYKVTDCLWYLCPLRDSNFLCLSANLWSCHQDSTFQHLKTMMMSDEPRAGFVKNWNPAQCWAIRTDCQATIYEK